MTDLERLHINLDEKRGGYPEKARLLLEYFSAHPEEIKELDGVSLHYGGVFGEWLNKQSDGAAKNYGGKVFEHLFAAVFNTLAAKTGSSLRILVPQTEYEKNYLAQKILPKHARNYVTVKNNIDWVMVENPPIAAKSVQPSPQGRIIMVGLDKTSRRERKRQERMVIDACNVAGVYCVFVTLGNGEKELKRNDIAALPYQDELVGVDLVLCGAKAAQKIHDPLIFHFVHAPGHDTMAAFLEHAERIARSELLSDDNEISA